MSEFRIDGRMKVKKLKELFNNEYGGTLRIYKGKSLADENDTLASIRSEEGAKGGELVCRGSRTVGRFEAEMKQVFGIKVQVATPDDSMLVLDGITLSKIKDIKKKATKEDMEALVAYKRSGKKTDSAEANQEDDGKDAKHVCINIMAECLVTRMCKVKEERVTELMDMSEEQFKELVFSELGEYDSKYFEEEIYDWYFMRYKDAEQSYKMEVFVDDEEVYSQSSPWSSDWKVRSSEYEPDEETIQYLESFKSDDPRLADFFRYIAEQVKKESYNFVANQITLPCKYLTGEYQPEQEPTYAGYRWVKQVQFSYEFDIPADEEFDISNLTIFENSSETVNFDLDEEEGGYAIEYLAYKDQLISGTLEWEEANDLSDEPPVVYMAQGYAYLQPIHCYTYSE